MALIMSAVGNEILASPHSSGTAGRGDDGFSFLVILQNYSMPECTIVLFCIDIDYCTMYSWQKIDDTFD